jgi:D-3-phosphoglycerate dehydrogenase
LQKEIKILVAEPDDFNKEVIEMLRSYGETDVKEIKPQELKDAFDSYDVIWFRLGHKIDAHTIGWNPRCKILATPVTGLDHIDEKLCREIGIQIVSLRGEKDFLKDVRATAELTVALTLALMRNLIPAAESVKKGEWNRDAFRGNELYGKTAGIIGMGRLGKITARYFAAFGMNIIGYDVNDESGMEVNEKASSIEELIKKSDVVSVHVNYDESTENLVGEKELSCFKQGAVLVNTSRGGVIDEVALLKALKSGRLKGAALDVIKDEHSVQKNNLLLKYARENKNLLIVPHIGGNTYESFEKTEKFIAGKLVSKIMELMP